MDTLMALGLTLQCEITDSYLQFIVTFVVNCQEFVPL